MTTKARTKGAKNRAKLSRVCELSGVVIGAADKPRPHGRDQRGETSEAARMIADSNTCRMMGWPYDEPHRAMCRDQRIGTLYGRLSMLGRLGKSERAAEDAYLGIAALDRLDRQYHRIVCGRAIPGDAETPADPEGLDPRALAGRWMEAQAVVSREGPVRRAALMLVLRSSSPDVAPSTISDRQAAAVSLAGLALARHFGLRA